MGRILDSIARISPGLAARRIAAEARLLQAKRLYEAVQHSNYRPRRGSSASADAVMDHSQEAIREYARWLDENHDLAAGVLDDLVANIVGTGVGVEPMALTRGGDPAKDANARLADLWAEFWEYPEITREVPGVEVERLTCRTWLRDGEQLTQHVTAPAAVDGSPLGYLISPMEPDFLPFDHFGADLRAASERTTHGVTKDRFGRPRIYHLYTSHPGNSGFAGRFIGAALETIPVAAENISHLKFSRRLHQTRGVSIFHAVFTRLDDLKDYEESERVAARIAAAFSAYIRKGTDYNTDADGTSGDRQLSMAPGMIFDDLLPGEEIGTIDPKRPNAELGPFRSAQLRAVSAGTGARHSAIARDYNGTYSAQRQELAEGSVHYRRLFSYLAARFYRPVWSRFVTAARLRGRLPVPRDIDPASLYRPQLRPPSLPWIDPKKEVEAAALAVENGFRSRPQVIRDLGGDPAEVDPQLAADSFQPSSPPGSPREKAANPARPDDRDEIEDAA